jgi:hypothetical protein
MSSRSWKRVRERTHSAPMRPIAEARLSRTKDGLISRARGFELPARPGDRLVPGGHHRDGSTRDAEILEVSEEGRPPYRVRWEVNGHVSTVYAGSDARIERLERTSPR